MVLMRTKCDHFVAKVTVGSRFTRQALSGGCLQHKEELMKKLIVLMIVLFPVTAWAGAHVQKSKAELCADINKSATSKLRFLHKMKTLMSDEVGKGGKSGARVVRERLDNTRREIAEYAAIYTAFCK